MSKPDNKPPFMGLTKDQAEQVAALLKSFGVEVEVRKGTPNSPMFQTEESSDAPMTPEQAFKEVLSTLGALKKKAMEQQNQEDNGDTHSPQCCGECQGNSHEKDDLDSPVLSAAQELAERVSLAIDHPMLANFSAIDAALVHSTQEYLIENYIHNNPELSDAISSSKDMQARLELNAIFFAVDIVLKAKKQFMTVVRPGANNNASETSPGPDSN